MKKTLITILLILPLLFSSCKQTLIFCGNPGCEIGIQERNYKTRDEWKEGEYIKLGTIGPEGKLEVKIKNKYYPYFLATTPGEEYRVPFGSTIRWTKYSRNGSWWLCIFPIYFWMPLMFDTAEDHFLYCPMEVNPSAITSQKEELLQK